MGPVVIGVDEWVTQLVPAYTHESCIGVVVKIVDAMKAVWGQLL